MSKDAPILRVAGWTLALLSALQLLETSEERMKAFNLDFADFLVVGIKNACCLLGGQTGACSQVWLEYQITFQNLYQEFCKDGVADASFYVREKTGCNEPITRPEEPTTAYFTKLENEVLERLAEGEFSARWMTMKRMLDIRILFMPIEVASLAEDDRQCAICREELGADTNVQCKSCKPEQPVKLPCGHVFGRRCMLMWLLRGTNKATCPTCRHVIFGEGRTLLYNEDPGQQDLCQKICSKATEMLFGTGQEG